MKTIKRAGLAAVIILGLGVVALVFVLVKDVVITKDASGKREMKLRKDKNVNQVFDFSGQDITSLDITVRQVDYSKDATTPAAPKTEKHLGLARVGSKWMITQPLHALAATGEADGLANAVADLQISGSYADLSPHDPQYGLDNPCLVAKIKTKNGKETELRIGKDTAIESNVYLAVGDQKTVYYAASSVKTSLMKEPNDLREKKVADFEEDRVKRAVIDNNGVRVICEQEGTKEAKEWWLTQPVRAQADKFAVDGIITALKGIEVKEFVDDVRSLSPYGLDAPTVTAWIDLGKKRDPIVVMFGKQIKKAVTTAPSATAPSTPGELKDLVYCRAKGRDEVFLVDADVIGKIAKAPIDLRDKNIVDFDVADVVQVSVVRKVGANFEAAKKDAKWSLTKPALGAAATTKIENFLWDLKDIKAEDFLDGKEVAPADSGLADPVATVTITLKKKDTPLVITFGRQEVGGTRMYCKTSAMKNPVLIGGTSLDRFPKSVEDLKETAADASTTGPPGMPGGSMPSMPPMPPPGATK